MNTTALIGIPIAAFIGYKIVQMMRAEQEDVLLNGGPDYSLANLTRAKVSKWSKAMLIEHGFYDNITNAPTPAFYALPAE